MNNKSGLDDLAEKARTLLHQATMATDRLLARNVCNPPAARQCIVLVEQAQDAIHICSDHPWVTGSPASLEELRRALPMLFDANNRVRHYL